MKTIWRYLVAAVVLRFSKKRTVRRDRELPASTKAETWTAILLFGAALAALAFVAIYAFADANTQLLGLSIAIALALIAAALWVTPARSQETRKARRLVPEEGAVQVLLLRQQSVQDDLKLTADETKKFHEFGDRQWKKALEIEKGAADERGRKYAELRRENERFVETTLTPEQHKRLHQIALQVSGLLLVTHHRVANELKLTDEQKRRAHEMQKEARRETEEIIHAGTDISVTVRCSQERTVVEVHDGSSVMPEVRGHEPMRGWEKMAVFDGHSV